MEKEYRSVLDVMQAFPDNESCIEWLEDERWAGKVTSPFDPDSKVYKCKGWKYYCVNTRRYFNVLTGTFLYMLWNAVYFIV